MKKITVIKFGGSLSKNEKARELFLLNLAAISKKESVVLVHGGGPEITIWLNKVGIETRFVNGLRYTDEKTLEIVEMVLSGKVNKKLSADLNKLGAKAVGISAKDAKTVIAKQIKGLGFVGDPYKTNVGLIKTLIKSGYLPVVSSLALDTEGNTLNVNSDPLAMAIAAGLKANRLILLTNVSGVLDEHKKTIKQIKISSVPELLKKGIITGGMIPKIEACVSSIKKGVKEVWIVDGTFGIKKLKGTVIKK